MTTVNRGRTEPRTEAGRALLAANRKTWATVADTLAGILAIEDEQTDHDGEARYLLGLPIDDNRVLLRRLSGWREGDHDTGPLIRWAAAHLSGCVKLDRDGTL